MGRWAAGSLEVAFPNLIRVTNPSGGAGGGDDEDDDDDEQEMICK